MLTVLLMTLIGCNDYMVHKAITEEGTPDIVVVPEEIDFGHLRSGHEVGHENLSIINAGDVDLFVYDLTIQDTNGFSTTQVI